MRNRIIFPLLESEGSPFIKLPIHLYELLQEKIHRTLDRRACRLPLILDRSRCDSQWPARDLARFRTSRGVAAPETANPFINPVAIACRCAQRGRVNAQQGRCPLNPRRFLNSSARVNRSISDLPRVPSLSLLARTRDDCPRILTDLNTWLFPTCVHTRTRPYARVILATHASDFSFLFFFCFYLHHGISNAGIFPHFFFLSFSFALFSFLLSLVHPRVTPIIEIRGWIRKERYLMTIRTLSPGTLTRLESTLRVGWSNE